MSDISALVEIMARLRDPETGCPWDLAQDFESISPYTIEEAYEVAHAIAGGHMDELQDELGDLLFQVVYHARLAQEKGAFAIEDVVKGICEKMVRRHPHVFGDETIASARAQTVAWEEHKAREKAGSGKVSSSILDDIPLALPALTRAAKLGRRASKVGFDWPDPLGPRQKIDEELAELDAELPGADKQRMHHEVGDILFAVVNLCRHHEIDPEAALRDCNNRFQQRFGFVEKSLADEGLSPDRASLEQMDALWERAKQSGG
jgi:MazG family protein